MTANDFRRAIPRFIAACFKPRGIGWFAAKYSGTCDLTGTRFAHGERIAYVGDGRYVSERSVRALSIRDNQTVDDVLETCQPWDHTVAEAWLVDSNVLVVTTRWKNIFVRNASGLKTVRSPAFMFRRARRETH